MSINQQVSSLEMKRNILRGLVDLVISLERLRASVEAVMLSGGNPAQLSTAELHSIEVIRQRVASHSNDELRSAIDSLDRLVNDSLQELIKLAIQLADDSQANPAELEAFHPRVNMFNRNARTSIALRALLAQRGVNLPVIIFSLPQEAISERLQTIEAREQQVRHKVEEHVEGMQEDISVLLRNPACPPAQHAIFLTMQQSLAENLAHIRAGLSLADLPMPIDDIEEDNQVFTPSASTEKAQPRKVTNEPTTPSTETSSQQPAEVSPVATPGLIPRVRNWLNSPWNSSWKIGGKPRD
jgi:hypothetical protein